VKRNFQLAFIAMCPLGLLAFMNLVLPSASEASVPFPSTSPSTVKLRASFDYGGKLKGFVQVKQDEHRRERGKADWKVKVKKFDPELCPSGLFNWHIHEFPGGGIAANGTDSPSDCGPNKTGGHYDPTFACGGASQNQGNGICGILGDRDYECSTTAQYNCEIGDQSGKMGKINAIELLEAGEPQKFDDFWINDLGSIEGRSIVLHCCKEKDEGGLDCGRRLACATLVDTEESSARRNIMNA